MDLRPYVPTPSKIGLTDLGHVRAAGVAAGIKASGKPDVGLLVFDEPTAVAGVFTQNQFAAAPVVVSREHLARSSGLVRAVVVNSGNANACTGDDGLRDARKMADAVARAIGTSPHEVLVCSTGVIGKALPMAALERGIERAIAGLSATRQAHEDFLAAIQTTDAFPKAYSLETTGPLGSSKIAGIAKGAGMIEPNMATMLAFVGCDRRLSIEALSRALTLTARQSFNAIHVDSHASTNDTFLMFATGTNPGDVEEATLFEGLAAVGSRLAWLIARDGEGSRTVTTLEVRGANSDGDAERIARSIARSALVRTAIFGADPNWGRIVSQVGNVSRVGDVTKLTCAIQGTRVFERGAPTAFDRDALSRAMAETDTILVTLDLGVGEGSSRVMTSDLGYGYIEVNAEYTT